MNGSEDEGSEDEEGASRLELMRVVEGEQFANAFFTLETKIKIAKL